MMMGLRAVGVLLLTLLLSGPAAATRLPPGPAPGELAPEIAGPSLQGAPLRLSDLRGKVVVLDFWASYCGPCIVAMPELDELRRRLHAEGHAERYEVLGVAVDEDDTRARAFLQRVPVSYPVLSDLLNIASRRYGVWRLPATFILDAEGRIFRIYHGYGANFAAEMERHSRYLIERAVSGEPVEFP